MHCPSIKDEKLPEVHSATVTVPAEGQILKPTTILAEAFPLLFPFLP